jgi:hypothetical protein
MYVLLPDLILMDMGWKNGSVTDNPMQHDVLFIYILIFLYIYNVYPNAIVNGENLRANIFFNVINYVNNQAYN